MGKVDFSATRKSAEREGFIGSGDYFKISEGANRLRLVSECIPHPGEFKGRKTFKWLCYVVDKVDGNVKPFFMPHSIYKQIEALQLTDDYAFESVPMPYDITINAKNAGTKEVEYSVVPARNNTPVTPAELAKLAEKKPLEELRAALRAKSDDRHDGEGSFDPDKVPASLTGDIPF